MDIHLNTHDLKQVEDNTQSLITAIVDGDTVLALQLLPVSDPTLWNSQALWSAVVQNNPVLVEALVGVSEPSNLRCKAIETAATEGYVDILRMLIPHILDISIFNEAFAGALMHKHLDCAQILYTLCEPSKALHALLASLPDPEGRRRVEERFARLQHQRISAQVEPGVVTGRRKI